MVAMVRQFPGSELFTSVYVPELYPEFAGVRVTTSVLDRVRPLARHYRAALPLLPMAWGRMQVRDADVVICSTTGWAHGIRSEVPKIAYCNNPARWLYQRGDYTSTRSAYRLPLAVLSPWLRRWDQRAAASCELYIGNSSAVAARIEQIYRRDAWVVWPPTTFDAGGPQRAIGGVDDGFVLCVSRLLGYKNVASVVAAAKLMPGVRWLLVGDGPMRAELERSAPPNLLMTGALADDQLRWAYHHCAGLVSASFEDFGLTPVEAACCGKPSALLRAGGFIDTCIEGVNGVFFDEPAPRSIADGVRQLLEAKWVGDAIVATADRFSEQRFGDGLRRAVAEVL